jgi:hypothetical protein
MHSLHGSTRKRMHNGDIVYVRLSIVLRVSYSELINAFNENCY